MALLRRLFKISDRQTSRSHADTVLEHGSFDQLLEMIRHRGFVSSCRTKVQKHQAFCCRVTTVIRKIWVCLNQTKLKSLSQQQFKQQMHDAVSNVLRGIHE